MRSRSAWVNPLGTCPEPGPPRSRRGRRRSRAPCAYGPNAGLPELRRAVATWHGVEPDEVLVTCGSSGALFAAFQAFVDPGDQVLLPDPGYPAYEALAKFCGAEVRPYTLDGAQRFRVDAGAFIEQLDRCARARLAIVNAPSNPTGGATDVDSLRRIAAACEARGVLLVSDEVYRELHFGDRPPSLRDVTRSGLVLSSVSKGWGAPGLRVGWAVGDPELLARLRIVHGYSVTAAARPAQLAALALVEASDTVLPQARAEIRIRFEALRESLEKELGRREVEPDGAFYCFLELPGPALADPWGFCIRLRDEAGVVLVPGQVFGAAGRRHVRLSFAAFPEQIHEGLRRMAPLWRAAR